MKSDNCITKINIINKLAIAPKDMLEDIENYIDFINSKRNVKSNKKSLQDIWKGKGFENINIKKEIYDIRMMVKEKMDKKKF